MTTTSTGVIRGIISGLVIAALLTSTRSYAQTKIDPDKVQAANRALKAAIATGVPSLHYMRAQLNTGDYKTVEGIYQDAMERYRKDVAYEHYLQFGYDLFQMENDIALSSLDAWVDSSGSAIAHAARGIYKSQLGSRSRGKEYISNTPQTKLDAMAGYYLEAMEDLFTALELDPTLTPAYVHLMRIAMSMPMPITTIEILNEALNHDDRSYYIRAQYMRSLWPRWGGSVEEMYVFGKKFAESSEGNPRLYVFLGEIEGETADNFYARKDYEDAVTRYTFALKFGDQTDWLRSRGYCYYHLGEYAKATDDFRRVLDYLPSDENALQWVLYSQAQSQPKNSGL